MQVRSQYLYPGDCRPFKVIQGNTVTLYVFVGLSWVLFTVDPRIHCKGLFFSADSPHCRKKKLTTTYISQVWGSKKKRGNLVWSHSYPACCPRVSFQPTRPPPWPWPWLWLWRDLSVFSFVHVAGSVGICRDLSFLQIDRFETMPLSAFRRDCFRVSHLW